MHVTVHFSIKFLTFLTVDMLTGHSIICGDFNSPGLSKTIIDGRLSQLISDHNFQRYVSTTRKNDGNVLDLVIARPNGIIDGPATVDEIIFSDHNTVTTLVPRHLMQLSPCG